MNNVDDLRAMIAFADSTGRGVDIPSGTYELDYPVRLPKNGNFHAKGAVFRPAADHYTPLLIAQGVGKNTAPIDAAGLHPDGKGWLSLGDYWKPASAANATWTFDIDVTLPAPVAGVGLTVVSARGTTDDDHNHPNTPFLLETNGDRLFLSAGGVRFMAGATTSGGRQRLVAQVAQGRVNLWVITGPAATLLIDQPCSAVSWPDWCDPTIGYNPERFPEGAGVNGLPVGTIIHRVQFYNGGFYSPGDPPRGTAVPDVRAGVWTDFASPDGCLFRGTVGGLPAVWLWRADTKDSGGLRFRSGGFDLFGDGRSPFGFYAAASHDWHLYDVSAESFRYGVLLQCQSYSGRIDGCHAAACRVALGLCNNSSMVTATACHLGEGNGYGLVAADSPGLTVVNGFIANNNTNVLVKGDNASLAVFGGNIGFEGTVGKSNVRLVNCLGAVFAGTNLLALTSPIPAVEATRCAGPVLVNPTFGLHAACPGGVKTTDSSSPPVVVGEGTRWGSSSKSPPTLDPANT